MSSTPFALLPASNPASPFYVPPTGTYQNNAGAIVPMNTPSSTFKTPTLPALPTIQAVGGAAVNAATNAVVQSSSSPSLFSGLTGFNMEDIVFIILGFLLIAAGIFAFKGTQQLIASGGKIAEVAAA